MKITSCIAAASAVLVVFLQAGCGGQDDGRGAGATAMTAPPPTTGTVAGTVPIKIESAPPAATSPIDLAPPASVAPTPVAGASGVSRTLETAPDPRRAAVLKGYRDVLLPAFEVRPEWTGSVEGCVAGDTGAAHKNAVLQTLNYYRGLAGLPAVVLNPDYSAKARQAALMMRAQKSLSHKPTPDWACYSDEGREAADHSNLALAYGDDAPEFRGPGAIHAYMVEADKPSLGHRRWLLLPTLQEVGTGDTSNTNALWVVGRLAPVYPAEALAEGVAWPPRSFVPWSDRVVLPTGTWSFSLQDPDVDFASAMVSLKNDRGQALAVTPAQHPSWDVISWQLASPEAEWSRAPADTRLTVSIANVRVKGVPRTIDYDVVFVTP